jgi:hypothetical protein
MEKFRSKHMLLHYADILYLEKIARVDDLLTHELAVLYRSHRLEIEVCSTTNHVFVVFIVLSFSFSPLSSSSSSFPFFLYFYKSCACVFFKYR